MKISFPPMHRVRCLLFALFALLFCLALPGSRTAVQAAPALPASVRLPGHVPAAAVAGARAMGRVPSGQTMTLTLALPLRDTAGMELFLERLYDPADPLYQHYITPEEFTRRYSPTQASYDAVAAFARAQGLAVTRTTPNRVLLSVSGPAAAVESAFAVHLGRYQAPDGRVFHAPDADPAIPASLVGRLSGVIGLDNAMLRHPYLRRHASPFQASPFQALVPLAIRPPSLKPFFGAQAPAGIGTDPYTGNSALTPSDIKAAYGLSKTTLTGAGQTLALFELDTYTPSDIATYETAFSLLPGVPLENVPVDASDPNFPKTPGGGAGEVTLDIEVMAAIAPGASKILVYESPNTDQGVIDQYNKIATDMRASVISSSWGLAELQTAKSTRDAENTAFTQMRAQGQSIFCASGDSGAYDDGSTDPKAPGTISVDDPASQPNMVGVGGTTLSVLTPGGGYRTESAWSTPSDTRRSLFGAGGGGGISAVTPIPDYQAGIGGASATQRNVPDVSLDADFNTGYAIYYTDPTGGSPWAEYGGTSVAAPIWAAFTALANQQRAKYGNKPVGFANPLIYAIGKGANYNVGFHDVNDGSNNLYPPYATKTGYDNSTGWGSFNGAGLLPLFAPAPNTTGTAIASLALVATVAQTPNEVVGGLSVTGTVTLANPAPAGGAVVTLTSTDALAAPVPGTFTVPAGQTSATFTINTAVTNSGTTVTITASYQGSSLSPQLKIDAPPVAIVPTTLALNPDSVDGGGSSQGTVTLAGPAPAGGLVVTLSSSSTAAQVPPTVTVPANSTSATFTVVTTPVTQQIVATLTASAGGVSVTATLTVLAPTLERIVLTPPSLPGGQTSTGTLTLTFPAPASGVVVTLSSDNPAAATVPASVSIPAGGITATFSIATKPVPKTVIATITATLAGLSQTARLEVRSARITGVSVAPASLTGGAPAVGTVTLDSPAAVAAGLVVSLAGSDPSGTLPATVTVPAGAATVTFPVTTVVVLAPVVETLTATLDGISKTTTLTIQPIQATNLTINPSAVIAGVSTTGTVTVNAPAPPGGLVVTLSQLGAAETVPATATVAPGATTATFSIGTPKAGTVTIAAVVGGQTRTATLTVTNAVGTSFPAGLNMVSTPYDYSGQSLDTLFGFAGVRLATWDGTVSQYAITPTAPADALRLGRGYFVKLPTAVTLTNVGTPADPTTDFSIPLLPGWNMIGDPFLVPVSLSALNVSSGGVAVPFSTAVSGTPLTISSLLYSFSPSANSGSGAYVILQTNGSLQPGSGYWIYAYTAVSLVVPHPGQ